VRATGIPLARQEKHLKSFSLSSAKTTTDKHKYLEEGAAFVMMMTMMMDKDEARPA
jgi:hypothetical protein